MSHDPKRPDSTAEQGLEDALASLLGLNAALPPERLRKLRVGVFERIAAQPPYRLSDFFRWRIALPAALSLLFAGAALGWTVDPGLVGSHDYMAGATLAFGDF